MNAGELCIRDVVTARADETAVEAAQRMARYHVGDLVVVEEHAGEVRPIGIVTDRDLVVGALARGAVAPTLPIRAVMQPDLVTAGVDDDLDAVLALMKRHLVRRVPIVNARGSLEGILSIDDVLARIQEQLTAATALLERQARSYYLEEPRNWS